MFLQVHLLPKLGHFPVSCPASQPLWRAMRLGKHPDRNSTRFYLISVPVPPSTVLSIIAVLRYLWVKSDSFFPSLPLLCPSKLSCLSHPPLPRDTGSASPLDQPHWAEQRLICSTQGRGGAPSTCTTTSCSMREEPPKSTGVFLNAFPLGRAN